MYYLIKDYYLMCIFDYLIANQDRHSENWELLTNDNIKPNYSLSPLFDNGSSLFSTFDYGDSKIAAMLSDERQFMGYNNRARSLFSISLNGKIQRKPKVITVLNYLFHQNQRLFIECFNQFEGVRYENIYECIEFIDESIIETSRKKLIVKMIVHRIKQIEK